MCLLALGKAASPMAEAARTHAGERIRSGLVVTKDGHAGSGAGIPVRESGHPVPDARSARAGREVLAVAAAAPADHDLWVMLSGGASSLLSCPAPDLTLEDLARTTRRLLESGADIDELNCVRKHLTRVSGGRLAAASSARRIEALLVSDVPGDRIDVIGSGPCAADPTTFDDALAILERRAPLETWPDAVRLHLEAGRAGRIAESLKPGDPSLERVRHTVVARNADAREAAVAAARRLGVEAVDLGEILRGEARDAARSLVAEARRHGGSEPRILVAGGETTVTVRGPGLGGRSQELALAAALELDGEAGIALLAAGTDGTDGPTDAAGAVVDGESADQLRRSGADPAGALARNDSYTALAGLDAGGLLRSGPTGTNVMDLVLVGVAGSPRGPRRSRPAAH